MKKKIMGFLLTLCLVFSSVLVAPVSGPVTVEAANLPDYYSSADLGYVTSVKDQGKWGTCWTFATMAAIETSLVKQGLADNSIDLSELAYAYFMFNNQLDPLGLTAGDGVEAVHSSWLDEGGYMNWACWLLAMNQGLVYEEDAPYAGANEKTKVNADYAYGRTPYAVKNVYWANIQDRDDIKNLIMNYGGVVVSYFMNQDFFNADKSAYNWDRSADATGHASLIVGWDDNYSASNFKVQPSMDGAWLIKNSWGSGANDGGYFWMSYECSTQELGDAWYQPCYAIEMQECSYDNIYQYDGTCGDSYIGYGERSANIFRTFGKERLEAVSFAFDNDEVTYTYTVYRDLKDMSDPTSGTVVASGSGTSHFAGYHVVDITPVELPEYCTYSVVVEGRRGSIAEGVLYESTSVFPCMDVSASTMEGTSWFYTEWNGWVQADNNCRIKAFTTNLERPATESEAMELDGYKKDGYTFSYNHLNRSFWIQNYGGSSAELVIPSEVEGIKVEGILGEAFSKNKKIKDVSIDGIGVIGPKAFEGTGVEHVTVKNAKNIEMMAFADCKLQSVYLENITGEIQYNVFAGNDDITTFEMKGHFGCINEGAFGVCPKLKKIEMPSVDILFNPFGWGSGVEEVIINGDVGELSFRIFDQITYGTARNEYTGRFTDVHLKLKKFIINGKVGAVNVPLFNMPNDTFDGESIAKLVKNLDIQVAGSEDGFVYSQDGQTLLLALPNVAKDTFVLKPGMDVNFSAFSFVTGLKHIICEEGSYGTLYLDNMVDLETVDAGSGCEVYLQGYTPSLTDIYIDSETSILSHTESATPTDASYIVKFGFTEHEVTVHAPANSVAELEARMSGYSFEDTTNGILYERKPRIDGNYIITEDGSSLLAMKRKNGKETIPEVEVICNGVYANYDDISGDNPYKLTEIVIPESVKVIGRGAFKNTQPKKLKLPSGIEIIGDDAFSYCGYFDEWDLGNALYYVGRYAFSETNIKTLIFPETFHDLAPWTIGGVNAENIIFKGDVTINATNDGLFGMLWREPDRVTFEGEVTFKGFSPVATGYNFTTVNPSYKDLLYYSLIYFGANTDVDMDSLPEAANPIDPERAEQLFTAYDMYIACGYPNHLFPYNYENIHRAMRDDFGDFLFNDDVVYGGIWMLDDLDEYDNPDEGDEAEEFVPETDETADGDSMEAEVEVYDDANDETYSEATDDLEEYDTEGHFDLGTLLLLIAVIVVFVGGIVGIVLLIKKKTAKK